MKLRLLYPITFLATLGSMIFGLEHEKSFLLQESVSNALSIGLYGESILISSSNDIVQRTIWGSYVQRTFRGHQSLVTSFVITNDSRMISGSYDDMIVVWSLERGSILRRIWLRSQGTQVGHVFFQNEQVFTGGNDNKLRHIDLVSGRIVRTIGNYRICISKPHRARQFLEKRSGWWGLFVRWEAN